MFLLTTKFFKNSHIQARGFFIFLKNFFESFFIPNINLNEKIGKAVTK